MKKLQIQAALQIQKPVHEVFEAIVDQKKMSGYFISHGSGRMEKAKTLKWKFPEFEEEASIRVEEVTPNEFISYYWETDGKETLVEMILLAQPDGSTLVRVIEKEMENDEAGIRWLKGNTEGWANFLACLKAYLEYGINLRKGAFDFLRK